MKAKIGINGLGRIGRMVLRSIFEENHKQLKVNHINNRTDINTACGLIKRDSIHGEFKGKVETGVLRVFLLIFLNLTTWVKFEIVIAGFCQPKSLQRFLLQRAPKL